jgi:predicted ArsR family transcriptional regulator
MHRVKLQAEVLVPLLRHLRAELGEEAANGLVYPVLRTCMRDWISDIASSASDDPTENFHKTSEALATLFQGEVDLEVLEDNAENLTVDVTGCRYADFFRHLGEPELGAILTCELDNHIVDLSAPNVTLSRTATIMNGAARCPFRYRFERGDKGA